MPALLAPIRWLLAGLGLLPLPLLHALGAALGTLLGAVPGTRASRVARRNLELCFPGEGAAFRRRLYWASFRELGKAVLELGWIWGRRPERALALVREVEGEELLQRAFAAGRGVILAAPHLGAWELLNLWLCRQGSLAIVYRPPPLAWLEPLLTAVRGRLGAIQIRAEGGGLRALFRQLAAGGAVGILPDQRPRWGEGVFAPFFGIPTYTMTLVSRLARRTGAPVLLAFAERLPRGRGFAIRLREAPPGIHDPSLEASVAALNRGVESCARAALPQYQWSYKRFSHLPPGESRPRY
ncbi:MAG: lipid A biosynthesis acyltransferase [Xanthomonadales bacterium]|nr:lipid A biosynthesis acyltransferase [Xanthomonadales bacterium]